MNTLTKIFAVFALLTIVISFSPLTAQASNASSSYIISDCDPSLPPSDPKGCGLGAFFETVNKLIKWLTMVVFPLAFVMIAVGGFHIMTAAGSTEKVTKGKGIIKIAVVGIIILLASYLIIQTIFKFMGVKAPTGLFGYSLPAVLHLI